MHNDDPDQAAAAGVVLGSIARRPAIGGEPIARPKGVLTPCVKCAKVPQDAPARIRRYAIEPTDQTRAAFRFWRECRAVNHWPFEDAIVRRCAAIIRPIYDEYEQRPLLTALQMLIARIQLGSG